ncbi:MAG: bifunctional methylenetetrahydrofolate dehydrogenase/methenyltetrahydrofolate cyclohydrolase FolD [Deltaproteobacteria bacterium]|nr:bifunctional methylenetetrahydrofolate dehydrogenase/methenyltetrahydrofolate cyclohydrolase FolD [Deltaproteobacteria bacterium]
MNAKLIDGKAIAEKVKNEVALEVQQLEAKGIQVGLAVILVGSNAASQIYVCNKIAACKKAGIQSFHHELSESTSSEELLLWIENLNRDERVHGILLQLPLPKHLNADYFLEAIHPKKDVDGLHALSLGRLAQGKETFVSCTPAGVMRLLQEIHFDCSGKKAVVVGRSNIVGKPMALLLLQQSATVTVVHSKTKNIEEEIRSADLVVAAVGVPKMVKGDWIKAGAVVIDVGINRMENGKLCGDVDFDSAAQKASYITPVPGGVGPMTIAMLLKNTLQAAKTGF